MPRSVTSKAKDSLSQITSDKLLRDSNYQLAGGIPICVGDCSSMYLGTFNRTSLVVKLDYITNPEVSSAKEILLKEVQGILFVYFISLEHVNVIKCLGFCLQRGFFLLQLSLICIYKDKKRITLKSLKGNQLTRLESKGNGNLFETRSTIKNS